MKLTKDQKEFYDRIAEVGGMDVLKPWWPEVDALVALGLVKWVGVPFGPKRLAKRAALGDVKYEPDPPKNRVSTKKKKA